MCRWKNRTRKWKVLHPGGFQVEEWSPLQRQVVSDGRSFLHYCLNYSQPDDAFAIAELNRLWQVSGPGSSIKPVAKKETPNNAAHGEGSCTSDKIDLGDNWNPSTTTFSNSSSAIPLTKKEGIKTKKTTKTVTTTRSLGEDLLRVVFLQMMFQVLLMVILIILMMMQLSR